MSRETQYAAGSAPMPASVRESLRAFQAKEGKRLLEEHRRPRRRGSRARAWSVSELACVREAIGGDTATVG